MFQSKAFRVVSDISLVILSATVGTFVWNHGSDIFNSGNILGATMSELSNYPIQYVLIFLGIVLIGILLWLRYKHNDGAVTKEDMKEIMKPIVSILCKIAKKMDIQGVETNNQRDKKPSKIEDKGVNDEHTE